MSTKHKTTTASRDPGALAKLQDFVREIDIAMVTTVTPDGALHSRPMATRAFTDDGEIWFFTTDNSAKVADVTAEHGVNLSYADTKKHHYVSVTGNATLVRDRARAEELWNPDLEAWLPAGLDDPHLALLRVRVETAEFWDAPTSRMVNFFRRHNHDHRDDRSRHVDVQHTKVDIRATPASG